MRKLAGAVQLPGSAGKAQTPARTLVSLRVKSSLELCKYFKKSP